MTDTTAEPMVESPATQPPPPRKPFLPLQEWLGNRPAALRRGPIAILLIEDEVEIPSTLRYMLQAGFRHILALSPEALDLAAMGLGPEDMARIENIAYDSRRTNAHIEAVNAINDATPEGTWLYYGFNAEYLFYPFSDHRRIGEMLEFHQQERRPAMLTYVIDLYTPDPKQLFSATNLDNALFDSTGYYALARLDRDGNILERQLDFHGGLRWRFEEYLPENRRRIDRIAIFRSAPGLRVTADHRFSEAEYNTYACPWHNNLTATIMSFRVAKALIRNPGSRDHVHDFTWQNSTPFEWTAQQLMDLGLMEPGQWF